MENVFYLSTAQLVEIANDLNTRIEKGLEADGTELLCLPTFIQPSKNGIRGEATVFDLGGTNFRAATVKIGEKAEVLNQTEKKFTAMKDPKYTREDLFEAIHQVSSGLKIKDGCGIGYCFSYPAKSMVDGDGELVSWSKGVTIANMIGKPVGKTLVEYLNARRDEKFGKITVVNDTITSLFAGLTNAGYDAYIGLIVGTGTNMATFFPSTSIPKIASIKDWSGDTPVNLETGNFKPKFLLPCDDAVDAASENKGAQRFEKAVSGMYIGRIFREMFPNDGLAENFDAGNVGHILRNPSQFSEAYVETAYNIYVRSAKLVAASIAGLVMRLKAATPSVRRVMLLAEGTMFWSNEIYKDAIYANIVDDTLKELLPKVGLGNMTITIDRIENANLIGAAMSVLS